MVTVLADDQPAEVGQLGAERGGVVGHLGRGV